MGISLEMTADSHSRSVTVDGKRVGTLLFHDWDFKFDPLTPSTTTCFPIISLKLMKRLLELAEQDDSIAYQKGVDERTRLTRSARAELARREVDQTNLTDDEAVKQYLSLESK